MEKVFRSILVDEIRAAVQTGRKPSPILRGLAALKFPLVITTNYDQLYEQALDSVAPTKASYDKTVYSKHEESSAKKQKTKDCAEKLSQDRPYLLKIHGDVNQPESIVVTDEDYIQFVLRMGDKHPYHPVGKNVLTHLVKQPTLFIGYRLSDYNLRLLFKTLRWKLDPGKIPPTYSVDLQPDVLIRDLWQNQRRQIRFIERNLWQFVPDLFKAVTGKAMPL